MLKGMLSLECFIMCSIPVKKTLFCTFCTPMYILLLLLRTSLIENSWRSTDGALSAGAEHYKLARW